MVLVLLNLLLYRKVPRLWWTYDDPNLLRTIVPAGFTEPFFNGTLWPQQLFTPLLMSAFQSELLLFGVEAWRWYAMQLAIACITTLAVYAAVRRFLPIVPSLAAAALFAASVPLCSVVTQLSTVHYLLSISLGALAVIAYVAAVRQGRILLSALSALLYLAAMLAKEVAIPLPLLLLGLPLPDLPDLRTRVRCSLPHWIALALYLVWRRAVIGSLVGAYGWVIRPADWPRLLLTLPWRIALATAGTNSWLGLSLLGVMAAVVGLTVLRNRQAFWLLSVATIAVVVPILPVAKEVNRRYALVPSLACAIAFAACAATVRDRRLRVALLVLVPVAAVTVNRQEWGHEFGLRQRMSEELRVFFEMPPNGLLRNPASPSSTMRESNWLKLVYLGKPAGALWFYDDIYLCIHGSEGTRVWEFDPSIHMVVEVTEKVPAIARRHCDAIRTAVPLTAHLHFDDPALQWEFGPYDEGLYTVIMSDGLETFPVPRRDALYIPGVTALNLLVRYDSPSGWTTYSPAMRLDLTRQTDLQWRR